MQSKNKRELIWQAIRKLQSFNIRNIEDETRIHPRTILSFLSSLEKAQILEKKLIHIRGHGSLKHTQYNLIKDLGLIAPKINSKGENIEDNIQSKIWRCIRVIKTFSFRDLVVTIENENQKISPSAVDRYLVSLKAAGYLTKKKAEKNYKLVLAMNTGPQAPQIQKTKSIYDPNLNKIVWTSREADDECN